ncbi:TolC family protein [Sphingomonas sp. ID1715]|uniref:TolC family protein n=1 Tax=Sphingomonas sp. ID1715 TaxID=1656898 RepID=UPI0014883CCA|nr:TolC family protein [Sphingomonas sp. ID1715]
MTTKGVCAAALLLSACATYRPLPLDETPAALSAPALAVLAQDAATIDRPFLQPERIDFTRPLDPNAVAALAVLGNRDLQAARVRAGVADAQVFAAGLLPDPSFSFGLDPLLSGPDTMLGISSSLGLNLNALRTRGVTLQQARADARKVRLDLAWTEWQTSGQARLQAARIAALERQVALDLESRDSTQAMLDRMLRAAGRGDMAGDAVQGARVAAFDAAERLRTDEKDLGAARLELAKLIGFPPDRELKLAAAPLPPSPPDASALFAIAQQRRTDLKALRAGYEAQEAAVHKAVLDQFPNLDLSVNGARDTAGNVTLGPAVSFTLPLWNRNRGGIAVERATRAALKAEYEARLFQTRAEIAAAVNGIAIARRQRDAVLAALPAVRRFAAASRRAADRGDIALATAATAEQALRDKEMQRVQAERDIAEQTIALELLAGAPQEAWKE